MGITSLDLARLRRDATLERSVLIENRCRAGEDPHDFLAELPTIDELVVQELRAEAIEERGLTAQYLLARLASRSSRENAAEHRRDADQLEREVLREIGLRHPDLTRTVWHLMGDLGS
ncbi:hypothetical protein [Mycetocola spongiae]|uniref:hypothetical protein n=1 Tax=Mycetocola spongiae TaxID=2859226 RepID=UPI001CF1FB1F|nr:hypothetical protein [Mycetocola spongiae]UCR88256.1 hypothetical protein KXZ72_09715 [Mycetocola spongiae]